MAANAAIVPLPSAPMIVRGWTDPEDPRFISFKDVAAAHHRIEEKHVVGKIVLHIDLLTCARTAMGDPLVHVIQHKIINIAPAPTLTGLEGAHDGMAGAMEMFGGVFTGRLVATADVTALQAQAKVNPITPRLEALFTAFGSARGYRSNQA